MLLIIKSYFLISKFLVAPTYLFVYIVLLLIDPRCFCLAYHYFLSKNNYNSWKTTRQLASTLPQCISDVRYTKYEYIS